MYILLFCFNIVLIFGFWIFENYYVYLLLYLLLRICGCDLCMNVISSLDRRIYYMVIS